MAVTWPFIACLWGFYVSLKTPQAAFLYLACKYESDSSGGVNLITSRLRPLGLPHMTCNGTLPQAED